MSIFDEAWNSTIDFFQSPQENDGGGKEAQRWDDWAGAGAPGLLPQTGIGMVDHTVNDALAGFMGEGTVGGEHIGGIAGAMLGALGMSDIHKLNDENALGNDGISDPDWMQKDDERLRKAGERAIQRQVADEMADDHSRKLKAYVDSNGRTQDPGDRPTSEEIFRRQDEAAAAAELARVRGR
jgi:hypothetical protein